MDGERESGAGAGEGAWCRQGWARGVRRGRCFAWAMGHCGEAVAASRALHSEKQQREEGGQGGMGAAALVAPGGLSPGGARHRGTREPQRGLRSVRDWCWGHGDVGREGDLVGWVGRGQLVLSWEGQAGSPLPPSSSSMPEEPCQGVCRLFTKLPKLLAGCTSPLFPPQVILRSHTRGRSSLRLPGCWSSSPPLRAGSQTVPGAPVVKAFGGEGPRRGEEMPLSPPCNANRNLKGPNSKVLIQARVPWPRAEVRMVGLTPPEGQGDRGTGTGGQLAAVQRVQGAAVSGGSEERGSGAVKRWPYSLRLLPARVRSWLCRLSLSTSQRGQASPSSTAAMLYVQPGWGGERGGGPGLPPWGHGPRASPG